MHHRAIKLLHFYLIAIMAGFLASCGGGTSSDSNPGGGSHSSGFGNVQIQYVWSSASAKESITGSDLAPCVFQDKDGTTFDFNYSTGDAAIILKSTDQNYFPTYQHLSANGLTKEHANQSSIKLLPTDNPVSDVAAGIAIQVAVDQNQKVTCGQQTGTWKVSPTSFTLGKNATQQITATFQPSQPTNIASTKLDSVTCSTSQAATLNRNFMNVKRKFTSPTDYYQSGLLMHKIDEPDFDTNTSCTNNCPSIWNPGTLSPGDYQNKFRYFASSYLRTDISQAVNRITTFSHNMPYKNEALSHPFGIVFDPNINTATWRSDNIACMYPANASTGKQAKGKYFRTKNGVYDPCGTYPASTQAIPTGDYSLYFRKNTSHSANCPQQPDDPICQMPPMLPTPAPNFNKFIQYSKQFASLPACAQDMNSNTPCNPLGTFTLNKQQIGSNEVDIVPKTNWQQLIKTPNFLTFFFVCDSDSNALRKNQDGEGYSDCSASSFTSSYQKLKYFATQLNSPLPSTNTAGYVMFDVNRARQGEKPFICPAPR